MTPQNQLWKPYNRLTTSSRRALAARLRLGLTVLCLLLTLSTVAGAAETALPENTQAPAFTLKDADGVKRSLAEYRGRPVVVFFACGCQWCHDFGVEWAQMQHTGVLADTVAPVDPAAPAALAKNPPITLIVYMGDAVGARTYAHSVTMDMKQTVLLPDADLKITRQYHAMPCPRLYVLDGNGLMRYVNRHADDMPQKATATVLVSKTIDGLRRTLLPPPPVQQPAPTQKPAPKAGKEGKNGKK